MIKLLIIGIIIILIALLVMLFSRSQSLQRFAILEFLLILMVTLATTFGLINAKGFMEEQYFSLYRVYIGEAQTYARDVENSIADGVDAVWQTLGTEMETVLTQSLPVASVDGEEYSYLTAAIYERAAENQYSEKVYRQATADGLSEEECLEYVQTHAEDAIRLGTVICEETKNDTGVMIYVGSGVIVPKCVYLTEIPLEPLYVSVHQMQKEYIIYSVVFVLIGTMLLAGVIAFQGMQMRRLVKRVTRVAEGKEDWTSLEDGTGSFWLESNEIRGLKNSLGQIASDVARMNYKQYRVLQGYYRFAPKQIEKILGRNSILEVTPNDRVHITGTLAFVAYPEHGRIGEQEYLRKMNREYEELGEKQKEYGGILLSDNSDLTTLQLLFQEETRKALHFGIDVAMSRGEGRKEQFFVMLHRTAFLYGIAGNDEQAFTYLLSKEMKMLEKYVERFRAAGIRMAVTDSVYELIEKETAGRYIGYLESEGYTFKIYEILDACPAKERQKRLDTKEKFEKALNLFYQEDYYLGRNLFTEVLKECPDDEVAKWYLFLCEKCLNAEYGKSVSGALFSD